MEKKKEYVKYYVLRTEDGPLYLYEIYKTDPDEEFNTEIPETREFFTQEPATRGFHTLSFLDGKCEYEREHYDLDGNCREHYMTELSPSQFLDSIAPFLINENVSKQKEEEVKNAMEFKAEIVRYRLIKMLPPEIPTAQKDNEAKVILKRYVKSEKPTE